MIGRVSRVAESLVDEVLHEKISCAIWVNLRTAILFDVAIWHYEFGNSNDLIVLSRKKKNSTFARILPDIPLRALYVCFA